jgi:sugar lactone lactonase YvrE
MLHLTPSRLTIAIAIPAMALYACESTAPVQRTVSLKPTSGATQVLVGSKDRPAVQAPVDSLPPDNQVPAPVRTPLDPPASQAPSTENGVIPVGHVGTVAGPDADGKVLFKQPWGLAIDSKGRLIISDEGAGTLHVMDAARHVTTLAQGFNNPHGLAIDRTDHIWVTDYFNHRLKRVSSTGAVSTLSGASDSGTADGPVATARFSYPAAVAVYSPASPGPEQVFIADSHNHLIRRLAPEDLPWPVPEASEALPAESDALEVTTVGTPDGTGDLKGPFGVAVHPKGYIYVADTDHHRILRFEPDSKAEPDKPTLKVRVIAGTGSPGQADGIGTTAKFSSPMGLALDKAGNLYVADYYNHCIRRLSAPTADGKTTVSTVAGNGFKGFADGPRAQARFASPTAVAVDKTGNLYVADSENGRIRKVQLVKDPG